MKNNKEVTKEDILNQLTSPILKALDNEGITPSYLAKKLKKELNSTTVKVFQDKGIVIYSDPLPALDIQQRARIDCHKLMDHYPHEKVEVEGTIFQVIDYALNKKEHKDNKP
jgi:hypothetical protein